MNPQLFPVTQNEQNCVNFETLNVKLNQPVGLRNDSCWYDARDAMSIYPGNYNVKNFYDCEEVPKAAMNIMIENPSLSFNNGYGWIGQGGRVVDYDSKARLGSQITNVRCKKQLHPRLSLSQPYMGRGLGDVCIENELQGGEDTLQKRQCNALSGIHIDTFIPLVPCLKDNIQNPVHIIPEDNRKDWVWGGIPSRQTMRQREYQRRCVRNNGKDL